MSHHGYRVAMVLSEVRTQAEEMVGIKHIVRHSTNTWQHSVEINVRFAPRIKKRLTKTPLNSAGISWQRGMTGTWLANNLKY